MTNVLPTPRQADLLRFIRSYIEENNAAPSFDEMRAGMNSASKSHIHQLLDGLEERGYITRLRYRSRALNLTDEGYALK